MFGRFAVITFACRWLRPTLEVVGIYGGFSGVGIKTIVPAKATVKISCRLVPDQDPDHVMSALIRHVETHAPPQTRLKFLPLPFRAHPYIMPRDTVANRAAAKVMATSGILLCAVKASGLPFQKVRSVLTR